MEQIRLVLGLVLVATQLCFAGLMALLFFTTRNEPASRYWALASAGSVAAVALSGLLPFGVPARWVPFVDALLLLISLWTVWRGLRSFRGRPASWWGWAIPAASVVVFSALLPFDIPQFFKALGFTLSACIILGFISAEAFALRESAFRWLVVVAAVATALSFLFRPVLLLLGYQTGMRGDNLPNLLATYLVPSVDFFLMFAGLALMALQRLLRQKDALATIDDLTQLPNRRALAEAAQREVRASCRDGRPFSLLLVDVDHFKTINDSGGHSAGDDVLRNVSRSLVATCRPTDLVCRHGGDEFVILCPGLASVQAVSSAQRLADAVRAAVAEGGAVTVSVGLSSFEGCDDPETWEAVFDRADRALYQAKEQGRDRVVVG